MRIYNLLINMLRVQGILIGLAALVALVTCGPEDENLIRMETFERLNAHLKGQVATDGVGFNFRSVLAFLKSLGDKVVLPERPLLESEEETDRPSGR